MEIDVRALQELAESELLASAQPLGCCAAASIITCPGCTFQCSRTCPP